MNKYDRMVEMVSRTFALSIYRLPNKLRAAVGLAYLLFRVSDCVEDHPQIEAERKAQLLELWEHVLIGEIPAAEFTAQIEDLDGSDPEVYVAKQAVDLMEHLSEMPLELQGYIKERCGESTLGMARWQRQGPFVDSVEELDDYMHQVAGLVGYLMTDIYTWYYPQIQVDKVNLLPISRQVGLGLQTVNVVRGIRSDQARGWMFIPKEYLDQAGITREQFFDTEYEQQALDTIDILADKAQGHLNYGLQYIAAFPRHLYRARMANIWPLCFAIKTLAISRGNVEVIRSQVKITRDDVREIMRRTSLYGCSNRWLNGYCQQLQNGTA